MIRLTKNQLTLSVALWMTATGNQSFWRLWWADQTTHGVQWLFAASLLMAITALHFAVLRLFSPGPACKPMLSIWLVVAAIISWFLDTYGVTLDAEMLRNALQTDWHESRDFLSWSLLWRILWVALLPMVWVWRVTLVPESWRKAVVSYVIATLAGFLMVFAVGLPLYKDYASFFRNQMSARGLITPANVIDAGFMYTNRVLRARQPFVRVGLDAKRVVPISSKPLLVVLVVGETARAANFSLGGYPRPTNPQLAKRDVFYFSDVASCGTATAISVPCMFSDLPRDEFDVDHAAHRENVLDVLQRVQVQVNWIDNQSGCKSVCARVPTQQAQEYVQTRCNDETCNDALLLAVLAQRLPTVTQDSILVLHQMGSHGPAYFRRTDSQHRPFQPSCESERIETCSAEQIINAYDNSIVYTDYILSSLIDQLAQSAAQVDSVLIYVSDHGESLGEHGLYLHGETYALAPEQQKKVPMLWWFSDGAAPRLGVNRACLRQQLAAAHSHDQLSHSLLGLFQVSSEIYRPGLDILGTCRSS